MNYKEEILTKQIEQTHTKCSNCDGEGGSVHPDGLSAEECTKCNGTGTIKTTNQ